jgi:protein TonB
MRGGYVYLSRTHHTWWRDRLLWGAVVLATVLHLPLLTLQFVLPQTPSANTKEVTLALRLSPQKISQADFLAPQDQRGSGDLKQAHLQTSPLAPQSAEQSMGDTQQTLLAQLAQKSEPSFEERVLITTLSWQKQQQQLERKQQREQQQNQLQSRAALIASIEAQYAQRQQHYAKQQKIKTTTGIEAQKDASAAYLERFRQKVEMFGNRYYPAAAKQQALSGEVRLMVIINQQGGLRALHLLESSGNPILDEAAKASVRRAMPFGAFDAAMIKDISELRIVRTWRFDAQNAVFDVH